MYCPFFSPFYYKYTLTDGHQQEMVNRFDTYLNEVKNEEKHVQPQGWSCEVETSFAVRTEAKNEDPTIKWNNYDPLNVNPILQHYIFQTFKTMGWPVYHYVIGSWYNAYGKEHYQETHDHLPHQLSGIYFLSYDEDLHGPLKFMNPFSELMRTTALKVYNNQHSAHSIYLEEEEPIVKSGDLIIFPSWLKHRVMRISEETHPKAYQISDELYPKRITISFNINLYDWFDYSPSLLENISRV